MAKKKLETEVRAKIDGLSIQNFLRMSSDVEFLSEMDMGDFSSVREPYKFVDISGGTKLYLLEYSVKIFSHPITILYSRNYTHAQIRDMRSNLKRKQRKAEH